MVVCLKDRGLITNEDIEDGGDDQSSDLLTNSFNSVCKRLNAIGTY
jgi:hypothetical protein